MLTRHVAHPVIVAIRRPVGIQAPLLEQPPGPLDRRRWPISVRLRRQQHDRSGQIGRSRRAVVRWRPIGEEVADVRLGLVIEARDERIEVGVGLDLGAIEVELAAPDQPGLLTQIDDLLEEALEDFNAESLPDAGQAGVVGQRLVQGVAEIPAVGQVERGRLDQASVRSGSPRRT